MGVGLNDARGTARGYRLLEVCSEDEQYRVNHTLVALAMFLFGIAIGYLFGMREREALKQAELVAAYMSGVNDALRANRKSRRG
jgi:hypothetical protein